MAMPDLSPAARALALEYVRLKGNLAEPLVNEILDCLKGVCRRHFELRNLRTDIVETHAMEMAYGLIHDCQSRRGTGAIIPFPTRG